MHIRGVAATAGLAAGAAAAYKTAEHLYNQDLERRMPEGGDTASIIPYLGYLTDACKTEDLAVMIMGGLPKQALLDPETKFDISGQTIIVPDSACRTRQKATLYRPGEHTIRDVDLFAFALIANGSWDDATPKHAELLNQKAHNLQQDVTQFANSNNFPRGPEVSLFGYERPQGPFRLSHYATVTELTDTTEVITHSLGARGEFEQSPLWHVSVDGLQLPTCSPVRLLGRTLVRTLVPRKRDQTEVYRAVNVLQERGLAKDLLGAEWQQYKKLRADLDASMRLRNVFTHLDKDPKDAALFVAAKAIAPLSPFVESSFLASAIRDPESSIGKLAARIMGAHS